ncbi:hypothetical protein D3C76_1608300 [compost metagenome]
MIQLPGLLFGFIQYLLDAGLALQQRLDAGDIVRVLHVNVRDLMIGHGKRCTGTGIKQFPGQRLAYLQQALGT